MFGKARLMTVGLTLVALAIIYRVEPAKDLLTGDRGFFG